MFYPRVSSPLTLSSCHGSWKMLIEGRLYFEKLKPVVPSGVIRGQRLEIALRIIADVCAGLHHAHELRDIGVGRAEARELTGQPAGGILGCHRARAGCPRPAAGGSTDPPQG